MARVRHFSTSARYIFNFHPQHLILFGVLAALAGFSSLKSREPLVASRTHAKYLPLELRETTVEHTLQEEFYRNQKMEAIDKLAGGVAHDFNNMLRGILGSAELLLSCDGVNAKSVKYAQIIHAAGKRACDLVSQLLRFARKSRFSPSPLDVHILLREAVDFLERMIDKRVCIVVAPDASKSVVVGCFAFRNYVT